MAFVKQIIYFMRGHLRVGIACAIGSGQWYRRHGLLLNRRNERSDRVNFRSFPTGALSGLLQIDMPQLLCRKSLPEQPKTTRTS